MNFAEVLLSDETARSMSMHLLSFFIVFDHNARSAGFYLPVGEHRHVSEYCDLTVLSYCFWMFSMPLMLICLDFITSVDLPVNVCCCLVMPINALFFR